MILNLAAREPTGHLYLVEVKSLAITSHLLQFWIWRLPPVAIPLIPYFWFLSLFSSFSISFFCSLYLFLSFSPPPTLAPSPLLSRRLISGAASQQQYLRKDKAPRLYSLFHTSLCALVCPSSLFYAQFNIPSLLLFHILSYLFLNNARFTPVTAKHVYASLCVFL